MAMLQTIQPERLRALRHVATLVIDVEPLVVDWDGDQAELDAGLAAVVETIGRGPHIVFVTNSARRPGVALRDDVCFISRARKPWTALKAVAQPAAVIGDQPLTDGLLARRYAARFLIHPLPADAPLGVRIQRWCGTRVLRLLRFPSENL